MRVGLILVVLVCHFLARILRGLRIFFSRIGRLLLEGLVLIILVLMLWHKLTIVRLSMPLVGHVVAVVLREGVRHVCAVVRVRELRRLLWDTLAHNLGRLVEAARVELFLCGVRSLRVFLEDLGVGRRGLQVLVFGRLLRLRWVLGALNLRGLLLPVLWLLAESGAIELLCDVLGRLAAIELGSLLVDD